MGVGHGNNWATINPVGVSDSVIKHFKEFYTFINLK